MASGGSDLPAFVPRAGGAIFVMLLLAASISAAQEAPAINATSLPTPANWEETCTPEVFHSLTYHYRSCARKFFHYEDPDADCCQGLEHFYGTRSPMPSRNCFCNEEYAAWVSAWEEKTYYPLSTAFKVCKRLGFTIGYFEDGTGICAGEEYPSEELEAACIDCYAYEKHATLGNWLGRLGKDWGVAISFAAFWISLFGCTVLLGSAALDFAQDTRQLFTKKKA